MQRFELLHDILGRAIQDWRRTFLYEEAVRQARHRILKGTAATVIFALLVVLMVTYRNYLNWEDIRPWGVMRSLVTGRTYQLSQDVANIGRLTPDTRELGYQVRLVPNNISRIHLSLFKNHRVAIDMRSLLGTTVNGEFLRYGDSRFLQNGDLIVLAGTASFQFEEINYRPLHFFFPHKPSDQPPANGWALLIDGHDRDVEVLDRREHFVIATPGGGVRLGNRQEPGAILAVTNRDEPELFASQKIVNAAWVNSREDFCTTDNNQVVFFYITPRGGENGGEKSYRLSSHPRTTIKVVSRAGPVFANIKIGDYCYGNIHLDDKEFFAARDRANNAKHSIFEMTYQYGEHIFQIAPVWPCAEQDATSNDCD